MTPARKAAAALALATVLAAGIAYWKRDAIRAWIRGRVVRAYVEKIQPHLPFVIEDVDADYEVAEVLQGRVSSIRLVVRYGEWRIRAAGPVQLDRATTAKLSQAASHTSLPALSLTYYPAVTVEPVSGGGREGARCAPVGSAITASIAEDLGGIRSVSLRAEAEDWSWPLHSVEAHGLTGWVDWSGPPGGKIDADLRADSLAWTFLKVEGAHVTAKLEGAKAAGALSAKAVDWNDEAASRVVSVARPSLSVEAPWDSGAAALGPGVRARWRAGGAEALFGEAYFDLPLGILPVDATLVFDAPLGAASPPTLPRRADLTVAKARFHVKDAPGAIAITLDPVELPVREALERLAAAIQLDLPSAALVRKGRAVIGARASIPKAAFPAPAFATALDPGFRLDGTLSLRDLDVVDPVREGAVRDVAAEIPFSWTGKSSIAVSEGTLQFKRLVGDLAGVGAKVARAEAKTGAAFRIEVPAETSFAGFDRVPLALGPAKGTLAYSPGEPLDYRFEMSLGIPTVPLQTLGHGVCLSAGRVPPGNFSGSFKKVVITPAALHIEGGAVAELLEGKVELGGIRIADLDTPVPALSFDAEWQDLQLRALGEWLNFGKMEGVLKGHLRRATFESWLPVNFDFRAELAPSRGRGAIQFDMSAMRNLVLLLTGSDFQSMVPRVYRWFLFDPFVNAILGGYDVWYGGVEAYSADGTILLETLDPPDVVTREGGNHFILYGPRVKMPVEGSRYPVVIDAAGAANYLRGWAEVLRNIKEGEEAPKETDDAGKRTCFPES